MTAQNGYPEDGSPQYYDQLFNDRINKIGGQKAPSSKPSGGGGGGGGSGGLVTVLVIIVVIGLRAAFTSNRNTYRSPTYYSPPTIPKMTMPDLKDLQKVDWGKMEHDPFGEPARDLGLTPREIEERKTLARILAEIRSRDSQKKANDRAKDEKDPFTPK